MISWNPIPSQCDGLHFIHSEEFDSTGLAPLSNKLIYQVFAYVSSYVLHIWDKLRIIQL